MDSPIAPKPEPHTCPICKKPVANKHESTGIGRYLSHIECVANATVSTHASRRPLQARLRDRTKESA